MLDGQGLVKVTDFGIAHLLDDPQASSLTGTKGFIGTLHYMAPEQAGSAGRVDGRADLYAAGVMLYEMLTGRLPFRAFRPASELVPGLDARCDAIIVNALQPDPADRYPSARDMLADVNLLRTTPPPQTHASTPVPGLPTGYGESGTRLGGVHLKARVVRTPWAGRRPFWAAIAVSISFGMVATVAVGLPAVLPALTGGVPPPKAVWTKTPAPTTTPPIPAPAPAGTPRSVPTAAATPDPRAADAERMVQDASRLRGSGQLQEARAAAEAALSLVQGDREATTVLRLIQIDEVEMARKVEMESRLDETQRATASRPGLAPSAPPSATPARRPEPERPVASTVPPMTAVPRETARPSYSGRFAHQIDKAHRAPAVLVGHGTDAASLIRRALSYLHDESYQVDEPQSGLIVASKYHTPAGKIVGDFFSEILDSRTGVKLPRQSDKRWILEVIVSLERSRQGESRLYLYAHHVALDASDDEEDSGERDDVLEAMGLADSQ